ncbi:MAG TPA: hypothetical protein VMB77_14450 [Syntrophales bacterium]|nr:hypothetical protein [Syntrophales bacterium]
MAITNRFRNDISFSSPQSRVNTEDVASRHKAGRQIELEHSLDGESANRRGPKEERQANLRMRIECADMDNRVWACRERSRERWQAAQREGLFDFMAGQIEIVIEGTDLKDPGRNTVLVDCIGNDGRHKNRDGNHQDKDAQSLHFLTRSDALALYGMNR